MHFADIILPLPLDGLFTYSIPAALEEQVKWLWSWIAEYYMSPIGEVYKAALPSGLKAEDGYRPKTETFIRLTTTYRNEQALHIALDMLVRAPKQLKAFNEYLFLSEEGKTAVSRDELMNASHAAADTITQLIRRGLLETYEVEVGRLNFGGEPHPENIRQLSAAQQEAYNQVLFSMLKKPVTLLHGVTSSGKTEIYIHLIQREIEQHRQVLYLLPEIALTVQMMDRLRRVFGSRLGIYHSKYSDAERVELWQKQLSPCPYDVVLGARSAVLLPFQRLGLIIVDEEHETSYKQQDPMPRYHARSVAIMLASLSSPRPKVLLGTATPSVETYHNAQTGKYGLVELKTRHQDIELPEVQVVDIQDLSRRKMMHGPFSPLLLARVREALDNGEQAILFQNRRGYSPLLECKQCGWVPRCQNCDVSLTYHRAMNQLTCHYCGATYAVPAECPACGSKNLWAKGYGTEKIETEIQDIFPEARIGRMDLDTTRSRNAYERLISDFAAERTNLLIGTQMISKGLDFDRVSVVGILNADTMLNQPDFRAYEHAYMMMAQVSGRAGRKGSRGLVVLQTRQPQLPVIQQVVHNDYEGLYHNVLDERLAFRYPPFFRLVYVYLKHRNDLLVDTAAQEMGARLRFWFTNRVLGPDKPSVARVKTLSIRKLMLKLEPQLNLADVRRCLLEAQKRKQMFHQ